MDKLSIAGKLSGLTARWGVRRAAPQPPPPRWSDRIPGLQAMPSIQPQQGISTLISRGQVQVQSAGSRVLDTAGRITGRRKKRSRWERAGDQAQQTLETVQERPAILIGVAAGIGLVVAARLLAARFGKRNQ